MPYDKDKAAPNWVEKMGKDAAKQWKEVWNSVFKDTGSEERAFKAAASVVKKREEKAASERRFTIAMPAPSLLGDGGKLARGEIIRVGSWVYGGEEMDITPEMLAQAKKNWDGHKRDVMLDYNHGSRLGKTPEEQKRAGDMVDLELGEAEDGAAALFGKFEPTEDAAKYLEKGEYKYLSAEFDEDYFHPEDKDFIGMYLQAVALTNRPFIEGMAPITLLGEGVKFAQGEGAYTGSLSIGYDCGEEHEVGDMLGEVMGLAKKKGYKVTSSSASKYRNSPMMMQPKVKQTKTLKDETKTTAGPGFAMFEVGAAAQSQ